MRQRPARLRKTLAMGGDQAPGKRGRGNDGNLLTEHGTDRELETIPGTGNAQPWPRHDQRRQRRVLRQMLADGDRVSAEVEYAP